MHNPRNKTSYIKNKKKDYFKRFTNLDIFSYIKDDRIYLGAKPEEVYALFNGNTSSIKKQPKSETRNTLYSAEGIAIDQSTLQYYMILGLQDFYYNYHLPLLEENKKLHARLDAIKKKNDERYEILTKNLEMLCKHVNKKA